MKKDKIDMLSKVIDSLYKKLVILIAVSGGVGVYTIKFLQDNDWLGYLFLGLFGFVDYIVLLTYIKLNEEVKNIKRIYDE